MTYVELTHKAIDTDQLKQMVSTPENGATVCFEGTVRNHTKERKVLYLDFEAYEKMALAEMQKIVDQAKERFDISQAVLSHRLGRIDIGQAPVVIYVGSAHRNAAFAACQYIIDTLKETVPIWKKEYFEGGEVWVSATP